MIFWLLYTYGYGSLTTSVLIFGLSIGQEDTEVHLGESSKVTMGSTEVRKDDSKVQPDTLLSDLGHEEPMEPKNEETGIQGMQYRLEKQDSFKKGMLC